MNENIKWLHTQLELWKSNKIVDDATVEKIKNFYEPAESKNNEAVLKVLNNDYEKKLEKEISVSNKKPVNKFLVPLTLSIISAVLIGAGIISLIAYNWLSISRVTKTIWAFIISLIPAILLIPSYVKPEKQGFLNKILTKELLASLWGILSGAAIEFLCQIYLLPMTWPTVFLLWFLISFCIFLGTKSYGAHGLTAVLLAAYCISVKQIFPYIPVAVLLLWYGLKNKKHYFSIAGAGLLSCFSLVLCSAEVWNNTAPLYSTLMFYILTAAAIVIPVYSAVKNKNYGYHLSTVIYSVITGVFYIPYVLLKVETVNASIVVMTIVLIYTLLFAVCMKRAEFAVCAPVSVLFICITCFNYYTLSLLAVLFLLFAIFMWRSISFNEKNNKLLYPLTLFFIAAGYFSLLFQEDKVLVCKLLNTKLSLLQTVLLVVMILAAVLFVVFAIVKHLKNRNSIKELLPALEILVLLAMFGGLLLYGYFGNVNTKIFEPVMKMILISLMLYGTVRIVYHKNYNFIPFIITGLLFLLIETFELIDHFDSYGPYFIFIFVSAGLFLQNKKTSGEALNNFGKVLFAIGLFIGIFDVYNIYYYETSTIQLLDYIFYNFFIIYIFAFGVLRPFIVSIRKKKYLNYVMPLFVLIIFIMMFAIQFVLSKSVTKCMNGVMPVITLLFVVCFSIYEIVNFFKKDSVAGVNVFSIYLVLTAFVKFFMYTNNLIARGIAFIFCGVIVLVTNLILSNYIKAKEEKHEK